MVKHYWYEFGKGKEKRRYATKAEALYRARKKGITKVKRIRM